VEYTFDGAVCHALVLPTDYTELQVAALYGNIIEHFIFLRSVRRLLVTANVVPSSTIFVALMTEA
jgi:hypothetical protein